MLDTFRSSIQYLISFACLVTCYAGAQTEDSSISLPDDLKWESECVPEGLGVDPITFALFQMYTSGDEEADIRNFFLEEKVTLKEGGDHFDWEYIGSVHGNHRVIRASGQIKECYWRFTSVMVLHREGDRFVLTGDMSGGGRHVSDVFHAKVGDDKIFYSQVSSEGSFVDQVVEMFPELQTWYDRSTKRGLCYGTASFNGWFDYAADISEKGEISNTEILMFHPTEGWDVKPIEPAGLAEVALQMLRKIDDDKPEEFKENGIAFSPVVFKELLGADLKDDDTSSKSVEISKYKDEPYKRCSGHEWAYVGRVGDNHIVYFKLYETGLGPFSGLYTVRKDGDVLEKVERIARQVGYDDEIQSNRDGHVKTLFVDASELTYDHYCSTKSLLQALLEMFPELREYAQSKDLSGLSYDGQKTTLAQKGTLTWKTEIAVDGSVKSRTLDSYKPYSSFGIDYEKARRYFDEGILLPIDQAVACVSLVYARDHGKNGVIDSSENLKHMLMDILDRTFPACPGH